MQGLGQELCKELTKRILVYVKDYNEKGDGTILDACVLVALIILSTITIIVIFASVILVQIVFEIVELVPVGIA